MYLKIKNLCISWQKKGPRWGFHTKQCNVLEAAMVRWRHCVVNIRLFMRSPGPDTSIIFWVFLRRASSSTLVSWEFSSKGESYILLKSWAKAARRTEVPFRENRPEIEILPTDIKTWDSINSLTDNWTLSVLRFCSLSEYKFVTSHFHEKTCEIAIFFFSFNGLHVLTTYVN